jgi:hypothetical protein
MYSYYRRLLLFVLLCAAGQWATAQEMPATTADTFFLNKKKGVLGRLGRSIAHNETPVAITVKVDEPFVQYRQKIIRHIYVTRLGFERNFHDTNRIRYNLGIRLANALHRNTQLPVIAKNLFFKEGDPVVPYLLADNERYLRELPFIQDARLQVIPANAAADSVDVVVVTKDVFSLGANVSISSTERGKARLYDENMFGTGNEFSMGGYFDKERSPRTGFGAEYIQRNIAGSFINWTAGFLNYGPAFNSGRKEEFALYTRFDKPLVSPYFGWTGSLELAYRKTQNTYLKDSLYNQDFKYEYYNGDAWIGYNLGAKRMLLKNTASRVRKFAALRLFHNEFLDLPNRFLNVNDYRYADISGVLGAFTIFKQVFYKTRFVYGFGRSEDVPEGYTGSLIGGWTDKQGRGRPYLGFDLQRNYFNRSGFYSSFTLRAGGYFYKKRAEDIDLLFNVDHFSRLRHLGGRWYHRWFLSGSLTKQIRPVLNEPLFLNSVFGLPVFNNGTIAADFRSVLRCESAFYNTWKLLGFRFAPFVFGDGTFLIPTNQSIGKGDFFSSLGAGVRTRNESLIFETVELRGYLFPRTNGDMKGWRIEFNTNIRFKYNANFIKRPDFVNVNL